MYKKIIINFKKISVIRDLLKDVHKAKSNYLDGILKFKIHDNLIPERIERAEIKIQGLVSNLLVKDELIVIPKNNLTFLIGDSLPYKKIENNSVVEDKYIVLPWKLDTESSRKDLKDLIEKIPQRLKGMVCTMSYSVFVNVNSQVNNQTTTNTTPAISEINTTTDVTTTPLSTEQAVIPATQIISETVRDFSWSGSNFSNDNVDKLLDEIEDLRKELELTKNEITAKDNQINNLNTQIVNLNNTNNNLQNEVTTQRNLQSQIASQTWTLVLPNLFRGRVHDAPINIGNPITSVISQKATIDDVSGTITFDIENRRLTIGGSSFGSIVAR